MSLYSSLLIFHSYFRWLVVVVLVVQILWLWYHSRRQNIFARHHYQLLKYSLLVYDLQFLVGWILLFQSPLAQQFWGDPGSMVKVRDVRFFGLEHITMMTLAVFALHGLMSWSAKYIGKRKGFDQILRWFLLIMFVILVSIPWSFSPFTHRPLFR